MPCNVMPYRHIYTENILITNTYTKAQPEGWWKRKNEIRLAKGFLTTVAHIKKSIVILVSFIHSVHTACCKIKIITKML